MLFILIFVCIQISCQNWKTGRFQRKQSNKQSWFLASYEKRDGLRTLPAFLEPGGRNNGQIGRPLSSSPEDRLFPLFTCLREPRITKHFPPSGLMHECVTFLVSGGVSVFCLRHCCAPSGQIRGLETECLPFHLCVFMKVNLSPSGIICKIYY